MAAIEKPETTFVSDSNEAGKDDDRHDVEFDPDATLSLEEKQARDKALLRKLDMRLIPWLCLLYLVSFVDRTNIGNASISGLQKGLQMSSSQYAAVLVVFFVSYSVFEPLSNILLKRLRPSIFIPSIVFLWGICCMCQGLVHNYQGLAATRWFLGLTEAGLYPGINYYLSCWYRRSEFGVRAAILFSAAAIAGSFGGLLAAAIAQMDGVGGKPGWAWIFILEGIVTSLIGVGSYWMVYDFPDEATFLSSEDRLRVYLRLKRDGQHSAEHESFQMRYFWASIRDWKTYTCCLIYMGCAGGLYAFSLFSPTIISQLGYASTKAQLLSVPPYAVAACFTVLVGYVGDRTQQRGFLSMTVPLLGITGFGMVIGSSQVAVRYAGLFLGCMGIYPCIPNTIAWLTSNTEGVYKRGVSLGLAMGWANLQGIAISYAYRSQDAPRFIPGLATTLGYLTVCLFGGSVLHYVLLRRENKLRRSGRRDHWISGKSEREIEMMGDRRPDFIYVT